MSDKYKTAEEHFLCQIVISIVHLHLIKRRNNDFIRCQITPGLRNTLLRENENIKITIAMLSDIFSKHTALPLHKAGFDND